MEAKIYLITCDETQWILPIAAHLYDKYLPGEIINVLGYSEPEFNIPNNFNFISMTNNKKRPSNGIKKWTRYLYNFFKNIDDEYIILTLDDHLICDYFNKERLTEVFKLIKTLNIKRYNLGSKSSADRYEGKILNNLLVYKKNTEYRITTQMSLWDKKYLLKYLNFDGSPWDFEILGSSKSKNDNALIVANDDFKNVVTYQYHGALTKRIGDKINILGLKKEDIEFFIDKKIMDPNKLLYGIWNNNKFLFSTQKFKFKLEYMKNIIDNKSYNDNLLYFKNIYKEN